MGEGEGKSPQDTTNVGVMTNQQCLSTHANIRKKGFMSTKAQGKASKHAITARCHVRKGARMHEISQKLQIQERQGERNHTVMHRDQGRKGRGESAGQHSGRDRRKWMW